MNTTKTKADSTSPPSKGDNTLRLSGGVWDRMSNGFWHLRNFSVGDSGLALAHRPNNAPKVVAKFDAGRSDFRIKFFVDTDMDSVAVVLNGFKMHAERRVFTNSWHTAAFPDGRTLWGILNGRTPVRDDSEEGDDRGDGNEEENDEFLDVCFETRFDPSNTDKAGRWRGNPGDLPAWMRAEEIAITPPRTGGGPHHVELRAGGILRDDVKLLRVNGVWMIAWPLGERQGTWLLQADPLEMEAIRDYMNSSDSAEVEPDEPMPPRSRAAVRRIHRDVGLTRGDYYAWTGAVRDINNCIMAMSTTQGQIDYYERKTVRCYAAARRYEGLMNKYWLKDTRGEVALKDYIDASPRDEIRKWHRLGSLAAEAADKASERAGQLAGRCDELRHTYEEAMETAMKFEAEYAPVIRYMHPPAEGQRAF